MGRLGTSRTVGAHRSGAERSAKNVACWALALGALVVEVAAWAQPAPDAGPPPADVGPDAPGRDAAPVDAGVADQAAPQDWNALRQGQLGASLQQYEGLAQGYARLGPSDVTPPKELSTPGVDYTSPEQVGQLLQRLVERLRFVVGKVEEQKARLKLVETQLRRPIARLDRMVQRRRRYPRLKLPPQLLQQGTDARQRLDLMGLELQVLQAQSVVLEAQRAYLERSQPVRTAARRKQEDTERQASQARKDADRERQKAAAESQNAELAQASALEDQRKARTAAERALASERARLQGIRVQQARLRQELAQQRSQLLKLSNHLNRFRGGISAKADELRAGWPGTALRFDTLYDKVVVELVQLRPMAIDDLKAVIRGLPNAPHPGRLSASLSSLDPIYRSKVAAREKLRARLTAEADKLTTAQSELYNERLTLLQREITGLNEQRISLLTRVTPDRRSSLMGATRATIAQLSREITQLIFDGLYWAYRRLRQIDQVPRLIVDVFTVGSVLWNTLKLLFLIFLLRFLLRRWDGWMGAAVQRVGQSAALGRHALRAAKLADILRHSGPALLVLTVASLMYHILGGRDAAVELTMVYVVFFWVAAYRVQLRVVESLAKYTGMEHALRAADEEVFEDEDPDLEGPPLPAELRRPPEKGEKSARIVPASVLLVRSVRATTRYILAVVLVLELTALAVGKGTFYGLTARFSWWATLPFVFYFLHLWRPHVERTYRERFARDGKETALERLVRRVEGQTIGVFVIAAVVLVLFGNRMATFARRYLSSRDATKKLLAFLFRKQVEKHAQQMGRVVVRRQELPQAILRQFPTGSLESADHPQRQPQVLELKEVFDIWQEDRSDGSAALVGHTGMGKTTVLNRLEGDLGVSVLRGDLWTKITRPARVVSWLADVFGFGPHPNSENELVKLIRQDTRPVVAIDNCHNLFLRQVGGFEGWETFIRVVNETCDNVFWVLAFNGVAWDYLDNITGRARFFRRVIHLAPWSEREIRRLIMTRMRRAGHGVSFTDLVVAGVQGVNITAQLGRTSQGYFRLLWDFTGGNPQLATYYWLNSLVPEEQERLVRVHLFSMPMIDDLEGLTDDIVFVLTAIAQHQNLTPEEAARTTNLPRDFCKFAFRYCLENEYLTHEPDSGRSRLSVRWQRPIQRFLKRKHLLYDV